MLASIRLINSLELLWSIMKLDGRYYKILQENFFNTDPFFSTNWEINFVYNCNHNVNL